MSSTSQTEDGVQQCGNNSDSKGVAIEGELTRHPTLWFHDGSVVLRAQQTLFKVHISQLSRHSIFFRDMFSLPQPDPSNSTGSEPTYDGCLLLHLDDSAEDLAHLLNAVYDGPLFHDNDRKEFPMISGILRLSTKYFIDKLRRKTLEHLSLSWPSSLKGWDAREDKARIYEMETGIPKAFLYPSPIAVINLARENDAPSLLPAAFYDLSRYHYAQIFEPGEDDPLYPYSPHTSLSASDFAQLSLGKESATNFITSLIQSMGHPPANNMSSNHYPPSTMVTHRRNHSSKGKGEICISAAACRKDFTELVDLATQHYLFDREIGCTDPLYVAEELGQLKSAEFSECKACAKSLERWACRERERMWKLIPSWFRLDQPSKLGS
ncbi:hypothetical protein ABKN59_009448 [Abortiporus biennis]